MGCAVWWAGSFGFRSAILLEALRVVPWAGTTTCSAPRSIITAMSPVLRFEERWGVHPISFRFIRCDDCEMKTAPPLARDLLDRSFTASDMAYLQQEPKFAGAASLMQTLNDFEVVAAMGDDLLFHRDRVLWEIQPRNPAMMFLR